MRSIQFQSYPRERAHALIETGTDGIQHSRGIKAALENVLIVDYDGRNVEDGAHVVVATLSKL